MSATTRPLASATHGHTDRPHTTPARQGDAWKVRASVLEGLINVRAATLLAPAVLAIAALVIAAALLTDALTVSRILRAEDAYLAAGGDLLVAQGQDGAKLDSHACVALANLAGVRVAAAVTVQPAAARLVGRPESRQTLVLATAGVLDLLDAPDLRATDVLVSRTIADRWQWSTGAYLQLDPSGAAPGTPARVLTVAGVADLALLAEGASTGVLALRPPTGQADVCFVRIEAPYRDDLRAAIPAALGTTAGSAITVADRLPAGAAAQDPAAAFASRTTRWAPPAAGAVVGLLWVVVAWTRRGRAALYASVGVPYSGGVLVRLTEGATLVVLGGLWGTSIAATAAVALCRIPVTAAVPLAERGGLSAIAFALVFVALIAAWQPRTLAALKDR